MLKDKGFSFSNCNTFSVTAITLLVFDKEKPFVEVETTPQHFEKRFIKTGLSDGINIEIKDGLKKTDKLKVPQLVVVEG